MADTYQNFEELKAHHTEGRDYQIEYVDRESEILVMAPHGGGIELRTTPIARTIAGQDLSFYAFNGTIQDGGNAKLHITSRNFDEPTALAGLARVDTALAIHGAKGTEQRMYVGGRDQVLRDKISRALYAAGFVLEDPREGMAGLDPQNIVNRTRGGQGVQLELSKGYRDVLAEKVLDKFAHTIREAIALVFSHRK